MQVLAGESVTVSGTLTCPEGGEAEQEVTLYEHSPGGPPGFAPVASTTSEPDGSYRIASAALEQNTTFFVRDGRGHSARRRVRVLPQISLVAPPDGAQLVPASRAGGEPGTNTVTFTGVVTPGTAGRLVVLQRESPAGSGLWRRVAVTRTSESGAYSITHTFKRAGEVTVRVLVRLRGELSVASSQPLTYTIAPRPGARSAKHARDLVRGRA
jgi:hypothetical protein